MVCSGAVLHDGVHKVGEYLGIALIEKETCVGMDWRLDLAVGGTIPKLAKSWVALKCGSLWMLFRVSVSAECSGLAIQNIDESAKLHLRLSIDVP